MKEKQDVGIIIQARSGSIRLPNKMVLPFYNNKSIIEIVIETIKKAIPYQIPIILATTIKESDSFIADIGKKENILVYRGDEENVLKRFIDAAQCYKVDGIIRVCADNPCLSEKYLNTLYQTTLNDPGYNDYISFSKNDGTPTIKTHYGFWAEYVKLDALLQILQLTDETIYTEHVTNYIYTHPSDFNLRLIKIPIEYENKTIRTTVDTIEDFENISEMYNFLIKNRLDVEPHIILDFIERHPLFLNKMKQQIIANQK
jgi:spore coat polysaccharide biosynthesis protein SpsF